MRKEAIGWFKKFPILQEQGNTVLLKWLKKKLPHINMFLDY